MKKHYKLTQPYLDLYKEYTGKDEISPANGELVQGKMRETMRTRGYIQNKMGRKAFAMPKDSAFDCLSWCIEQSINDLCVYLKDILNKYLEGHGGSCTYSKHIFTVTFPDDKQEYYLTSIPAIISECDGKLIRSSLTVREAECEEQLGIF